MSVRSEMILHTSSRSSPTFTFTFTSRRRLAIPLSHAMHGATCMAAFEGVLCPDINIAHACTGMRHARSFSVGCMGFAWVRAGLFLPSVASPFHSFVTSFSVPNHARNAVLFIATSTWC